MHTAHHIALGFLIAFMVLAAAMALSRSKKCGNPGREDSNLRMAESKSDYFSFKISVHSEKIAKFDPLSINGIARISEPSAGKLRRHRRIPPPAGLPFRFS
jgi:hypothetical protein